MDNSLDIVQDLYSDGIISSPEYVGIRDSWQVNGYDNANYMDSNTQLGLTNSDGSAGSWADGNSEASGTGLQDLLNIAKSFGQDKSGALNLPASLEGIGDTLSGLGLLGIAVDLGSTAAIAISQEEAGNTLGALDTIADFSGRLGGALVGAEEGAELGGIFGPIGSLSGALLTRIIHAGVGRCSLRH